MGPRNSPTRLDPKVSLADDLMAIGADCAKRLSLTTMNIDHEDLLYGTDGLPLLSDSDS